MNPAVLWDLSPFGAVVDAGFEVDEERVLPFVVGAVESYKEEIMKERRRQGDVKSKYGLKSLEYLIGELDAELTGLYLRQANGEKVDLLIRNKEEQKKRYEDAYRELKDEIQREVSLSISMPELLSVIRVIPETGEMASNEEIERIGMEIAMEYERRCGREPEDVSKENLGFDIRSKGKDEVRYIEVKARVSEGDVALTPNELFKARRFKEQYWLYIVANAAANPTLYIINNPCLLYTSPSPRD